MNKRTIILIVIVECILAVFLISFVGKVIESYNKTIYAEEIYFTTKDGRKIPHDSLIEIEIDDYNINYQLYWEIQSKDTTNKEVIFIVDKPESVIVDKTGYITFIETTDVVITIKTTDSSDLSATITLIVKEDIHADVDI